MDYYSVQGFWQPLREMYMYRCCFDSLKWISQQTIVTSQLHAIIWGVCQTGLCAEHTADIILSFVSACTNDLVAPVA